MRQLMALLFVLYFPSNLWADTPNFEASIIGGQPVKASDPIARSVVAVYDNFQHSLCTGSLLANDVVITARHCVAASVASDLVIVFGLDVNAANIQKRKVVGYRDYDPREGAPADIGVIKFSGALPAGYAPASLLTDNAALKDGISVILAGYGMTNRATKEGVGLLRKVNANIKTANWSKTEVLIDQTKGKGACHGDSGGPAYVSSGSKLLLFGVTSRGINDPQDTCGQASAYTKITPFLGWLRNAAEDIGQDCIWPMDSCGDEP